MTVKSEKMRERVYRYLNELRDSGKVNMFMAGPYLAQRFGFDAEDTREWLFDWMSSFDRSQ